MTGKPHLDWRLLVLRAVAIAAGLAFFLVQSAAPVTASGETRTLWLHHTHTGKDGKFTFKRDGQYDTAVLREMNVFLADWRTGTPTKMDPHLFDLLWEVYQDVGASQPYNIVSSYREPKTNAMLRAKSSGVAENSQHMQGKAMDVFIPGIKLSTLRAAAMKHQVGGVGFYPTSGSPFVHMDTGNVRAWPRMTTAQLRTVFPDGKTLHLPVDGKPLSQTGYAYAQAEWKKCKTVPCSGRPSVTVPETEILLASLDPAQRSVKTIDVIAPMPLLNRPRGNNVVALDPANNPFTALDNPFNNPSAPLNTVQPMAKPPTMMVATRDILPSDGQTALSALRDFDSAAPQPRMLMTPRDPVVTAYAPEITPDPGAQRALDLLIQRETAAAEVVLPAEPPVDTSDIRLASLGGTNGMNIAANIFDMTWSAVTQANGSAISDTLLSAVPMREAIVGLKPRDFDLIAPEIDHVNETLVEPVLMSDMHFAELYEPEGYLDNAAELGPMANRIALEPDDRAPPRYDIFVVRRPMLVASR